MSRSTISSSFLLLLFASVLSAAQNPRTGRPNTTKSVSYALLEDYDKGTDLKQVALDFQLMRTLGIDTWRGSFGWDDYEPQRGVYDFGWLHSFAQLADRYGIKLRPYIGYTPDWAAAGGRDKNVWNDPPRKVQDWFDFLYALTRAMSVHSNILSYEIYNEVNDSTWWDGSASAYNEILRAGADAIRRGDPHAQVLMAGMVYPDYGWLSQICEDYGNAAVFDIVPFHAYPETWETSTVETYLDAQYYERFVPEVEQQCKRQPIWINELGFATTKGVTERQQAYWWARAFAAFLSDAHIQELGIYQIRDVAKGHDVIGGVANYHLGITRQDRKQKLAFSTIEMLVKLLKPGIITTADNDVIATVTSGRPVELHYHLFRRPDGHQILFAYDKRGNPTVSLTLSRRGSKAISYSLNGKAHSFRDFDGNTLARLKLAPGQIFVLEILP